MRRRRGRRLASTGFAGDSGAAEAEAGSETGDAGDPSVGDGDSEAGTGDEESGDGEPGNAGDGDGDGDGESDDGEPGDGDGDGDAESGDGDGDGGCALGAQTLLQTTVKTVIYQGVLREPGRTAESPYPRVHLLLPADACEISVTLDPDDFADSLEALVRDENGDPVPGADCQAQNGGPCTIELAEGPGVPVAYSIELQDQAGDDDLHSLAITIAATIEGLVDEAGVSGSFRGASDSDYVLYPVGPVATAFSYDGSATTDFNYNVGIIAAGGALTPQIDVVDADPSKWPQSGNPQGWYSLSASTTTPDAAGDAWTLTVTP